MAIKTLAISFCLFFGVHSAFSQKPSAWSAKVSIGAELPRNGPSYRGQSFQRAGWTGAIELGRAFSLVEKIEFEIPVGIYFSRLSKSKNYDNDCLIDVFPTFLSLQDSLMGRDMKFVDFRLAPSIRYWLTKRFGLGAAMWASVNLSARIEDYEKTCGQERHSRFLKLEDGPGREVENVGMGAEIFISVRTLENEAVQIRLEPGFSSRFTSRTKVYLDSPSEANPSSSLKTFALFLRVGLYFW